MKIIIIIIGLFFLSDFTKGQSLTFPEIVGLLNKDIGDIDTFLTEKGWAFDAKSPSDSLGFYSLKWTYNRDISPVGDTLAARWIKITKRDNKTIGLFYQFQNKKEYSTTYNSAPKYGLKKSKSTVTDDNNIETKFIGKKYFYYFASHPTDDNFTIEIVLKQ